MKKAICYLHYDPQGSDDPRWVAVLLATANGPTRGIECFVITFDDNVPFEIHPDFKSWAREFRVGALSSEKLKRYRATELLNRAVENLIVDLQAKGTLFHVIAKNSVPGSLLSIFKKRRVGLKKLLV